ncbi:MAG: D-2-hydroxyacid dehydrogenase [Bacteroidaceae bacterium]|nr:D-2-hydroxyacid dehydrogenase [Bacteroidaceae bacterium]
MTAAILDSFSVTQNDLDWHELSQQPDLTLTIHDRTRTEETIQRARDCELVLTNKVEFSRQVISALPRLRYIGVLATGYNVVDTEAARERGITVTNIPAYSTPSVAQQVFAHLLNVTNSVAHYADENRRGRWSKSPDFLWMDTPLTELARKTMVIRGMGNIGTQVAQIALAFGMRVVAVSHRTDLPEGVERTTWTEALRQADVLSLHCPLTRDTHHLLDALTLTYLKPEAIVINTGRGPLVDEHAMALALHSGRLRAYCADVLSVEPAWLGNPLLKAPRCYLTPHIAWATREARQRLIHTATHNVEAFLTGHPVNVVS